MQGSEAVSLLYSAHQQGQKYAGVDIDVSGSASLCGSSFKAEYAAVKNVVDAGIYDTYASKFWGITFAANAAVTVLRVDQVCTP